MTLSRPALKLFAAILGLTAGQQALAQAMATPPAATAPASATPPAAAAAPSDAVPSTTTAMPAAAAPAKAVAGMTVKDAAGGIVGTVTKVGDGFIAVKTDKHEANLPTASFTAQGGALLFGETQAQLNAEIEKQDAATAALFKVGTKVSGSAGADAGTISALDSSSVTLKLPSGKVVRVPRSGIAASGDALVVGLTAAELEAAAVPASTTTTKKTGSVKKSKKKK